jgi:hypothetical protein
MFRTFVEQNTNNMFIAYGTPVFVITMFVIYKLMSGNGFKILENIGAYLALFLIIIGFSIVCYMKMKIIYPYLIGMFITTTISVFYKSRFKFKEEFGNWMALITILINIFLCGKIIYKVGGKPTDFGETLLFGVGSFMVGMIFTGLFALIISKILKIKQINFL